MVQILTFHLFSKRRGQIILALCRKCSERSGGGEGVRATGEEGMDTAIGCIKCSESEWEGRHGHY